MRFRLMPLVFGTETAEEARKWSISREDLDAAVPRLHEAVERVREQADRDGAEQRAAVRRCATSSRAPSSPLASFESYSQAALTRNAPIRPKTTIRARWPRMPTPVAAVSSASLISPVLSFLLNLHVTARQPLKAAAPTKARPAA